MTKYVTILSRKLLLPPLFPTINIIMFIFQIVVLYVIAVYSTEVMQLRYLI